MPISHTRDTAGPIARNVADCALLDGVVCDQPEPLPPVAPTGLRLGVPRRHFWDGLDAELGRICEDAIGRLRAAGIELVEVDLTDAVALDGAAGFPIALYETVTDLNRYLAQHGSALDFAALAAATASPDVGGILRGLAGAGAVPEAAYREALDQHRPALQEFYRRRFRDHDVAAMIFPTTPAPAAPIGEDENVTINGAPMPTFTTFIRNSSPGSVAGIPGLSLPVGIEIDGPAGSDRRLLAIGAALEQLLPPMPAPPATG